MRAPGFWSLQRPTWQARLLSPLGWIYGLATAHRVRRAPTYRASVPVICLGNISVGGTGKTPTAIALAERLIDAGLRPAIISRGHGGSLPGPLKVDPARHDAIKVGDEPILMEAFAPVYIARERAEAARMAEADGCDIIVMSSCF